MQKETNFDRIKRRHKEADSSNFLGQQWADHYGYKAHTDRGDLIAIIEKLQAALKDIGAVDTEVKQ
jgi:hypothetical protein